LKQSKFQIRSEIYNRLAIFDKTFDTISFIFSSTVDLNRLIKVCKQRGFEILSYDPRMRSIQIEVPLNETRTTVEFNKKRWKYISEIL